MEPDGNDAEWHAERHWLIEFMRQGLPITTEAEQARVLPALKRLLADVGEDIERKAIHESGHAIVAYSLDWLVEYVEPELPDGGAGALSHQKRLEYSKLKNEWEQFLEQATVAVAGYIAEEIEFGLAVPYEVIELRDRAWEEHGVGDDQLAALIEHSETQARAILTARWTAVKRLAAAQIASGRVDGDALAAILAGP